MRSNSLLKQILLLALAAACAGCGGGDSAAPAPAASGDNVMAITVNGSLCSGGSYINKPCVSVTLCSPGTSTCQTVSDILLDTGDSGLRIFRQVLTAPLTQVASGAGSLAECIQYADGSSVWGPVKRAGVILANEPAVQVPIQVIDSTFAGAPAACAAAYQTPLQAGYNGSLGVSFFEQDCGDTCRDNTSNGVYYACSGGVCSEAKAELADQVNNPVAALPVDNNGVLVQLPGVPAGGATTVSGSLILGIGTRANNIPSGVTRYPASAAGNFFTTFDGSTYGSFIDTGSNGLFFPATLAGTLPDCAFPNAAWFCPPVTRSLSAVNTGSLGSPSGTVSFQIGNFDSLMATPNNVFSNIGGGYPGGFDWGLPFHFGRNVYIGIEKKSSSLGTGPYWAY